MSFLDFEPMTKEQGAQLALFTARYNSLTDKELQTCAECLQWGTYGPNGDKPMKVRYLNDLNTDHLQNILVTQSHISSLYRKVILWLLKKRWTEISNPPNRLLT